MTVNITNLTVLETGKKIPLGPGEILVVEVSFNYTVSQATDVVLWASLGLAIGRDIESFKTIHLDRAPTSTKWEGETEILIPASGKTNGTYWMKVEVNGTEVTIGDAVVISGMPVGILDMIPMLMVVMMMGIMMSVMD